MTGAPKRRRSRPGRNSRRFYANRSAVASLVLILLLVLVGLVSIRFTPSDPNVQNLYRRLHSPDAINWLGTDLLGRDILSRLMVATRVTLFASLEALAISVVLGIPIGLLAGYVRGVLDTVVSRIADGVLAVPPLIVAMAIVGVLGPGLTNAMIAVGVSLAPRFFRLAQAAAQSTSAEAYVEAARADGSSTFRILWRHILPNSAGPLLVQATFGIGLIITAEASLSFLGLGVQLPEASLGSMIRSGFEVVRVNPFAIVPATLVVVVLIVAFFQLGDGLRDAVGRDTRPVI
jgi:peptide/nickel transport system permease protein